MNGVASFTYFFSFHNFYDSSEMLIHLQKIIQNLFDVDDEMFDEYFVT